MALRNQPYIPLYVQDFMMDEKLIECSAAATGVYIRIMCMMHKSDKYGTILLDQKYQQSAQQAKNFAAKIGKHLPYSESEIEAGLIELLDARVLKIDGDMLIQKRMVKDNLLSQTRAKIGSKGGKKTAKKLANYFAAPKEAANTEYENEYENENKLKKEAPKKSKEELMKERAQAFAEDLRPFIEIYGQEMVTKFYKYWTEPNRSRTKMRFELNKTWETKLRLLTWAARDSNFNGATKEDGLSLPKQ